MTSKFSLPTDTLNNIVRELGLHKAVSRLHEAAMDLDNPFGLLTGRELADLTFHLLVATANQGMLLGIELASNKDSGWSNRGLKNRVERGRMNLVVVELLTYASHSRTENCGEGISLGLYPHEEEALILMANDLTYQPQRR